MLTTIIFYIIPGTAITVYSVLRLGPRLPIASRRMGQRIGLGYQLAKSLLKINIPTDIVKSNEMVKLLRQTDQQAKAFTRELRSDYVKMKQDIHNQMPADVKHNPFQMLSPRYENQQPSDKNAQTDGPALVASVIFERERLLRQKNEKLQNQSFANII